MTSTTLRRLIAEEFPAQRPERKRFFHHPCHDAGPLTLEWSAAAYERMQAQRDFLAEDHGELWSWDDPYVKAAVAVERADLEEILLHGYGGRLTYPERTAL